MLTGTILAMGGTSNPNGIGMAQELDGYLSTAPGTPYAGYTFEAVTWPAQFPFTPGSNGELFDSSQAQGVRAITQAISATYQAGNPLVLVGYSSSADVMTRILRGLQASRDAGESAPSPSDLSFVLFGDPNRPNGGILERFVGLYIPVLGVTFDGATPATDYKVTDVSWEYDAISDFPLYPLNLLADLNALVGYFTVHGSYFTANPSDTADTVQEATVGNTHYITLAPAELPLMVPLRLLGVPPFIRDAIEPVLKYLIDLGYNRSISPGTPMPARWTLPPVNPVTFVRDFIAAVGEGLRASAADIDAVITADIKGTEATIRSLQRQLRSAGNAPVAALAAVKPEVQASASADANAATATDPIVAQTRQRRSVPTSSGLNEARQPVRDWKLIHGESRSATAKSVTPVTDSTSVAASDAGAPSRGTHRTSDAAGVVRQPRDPGSPAHGTHGALRHAA
jgi:hypothetical protein